jgi:hypothetical protein
MGIPVSFFISTISITTNSHALLLLMKNNEYSISSSPPPPPLLHVRKPSIYECVGVTFNIFLLITHLLWSRDMVDDIVFSIVNIIGACSLASRIKGIMYNKSLLSRKTDPTAFLERGDVTIRVFYNPMQPKYPVIIDSIRLAPLSHYLYCVIYASTPPPSPDYAYGKKYEHISVHDNYPYLNGTNVAFRPTHMSSSSSSSLSLYDMSFNQQWNEKTVLLNLVSMEIMLQLTEESKAFPSNWRFKGPEHSFEYLMGSNDSVLVAPTLIRDSFPCSSVPFDGFGSLTSFNHNETFDKSDGKHVCVCGHNFMMKPGGDRGELIIGSHSPDDCPLSVIRLRLTGSSKKPGLAINIENDILLERIEDFDKMVIACNEFVKKHGIIEKLRADFPLLPFPDAYSDCLFYPDGKSYRVKNSLESSSTVERAQLLYHHYDHLTELLKQQQNTGI